jgi:dUTPase
MKTWCLKLYARSGIGIKDKVVITNGTGLVDGDFQFSKNDGDMLIALTNTSDEIHKYKAGDRVCQAVFEIYGITSDDKASEERTYGIGSTGKE